MIAMSSTKKAKAAPKTRKTATPTAASKKSAATTAEVKTTAKTKAKTEAKTKVKSKTKAAKGKVVAVAPEKAKLISSEVVWENKLFRILHDKLVEPGGHTNERDIIRHNGSVVILAIDSSSSKKNPWIVMERQYRHAAQQFLWELPAGKLEAGEDPLEGAKRELAEETGYAAKKWKPLVEYFASPGFLGESMKVFLAEGLVAGDAHPEEDEKIELRLVRMNDVLKMIDKGMILDGKTMTSVMLYSRQITQKRKK